MLNHIEELDILELPDGKYAIFGSGPMGIRNIRDSQDIDIIVKSDLWEGLIKKYKDHLNKELSMISIGNLEIGRQIPYLSDKVDEMIESAEIIEDLPFVRLEYVIEWKELMGRDKDKKDVELIKYHETASRRMFL